MELSGLDLWLKQNSQPQTTCGRGIGTQLHTITAGRYPVKRQWETSSISTSFLQVTCQLCKGSHFRFAQVPGTALVQRPEDTANEVVPVGEPKVLRTRQFLALLTSKCASRHNGVHFFDISTSKRALEHAMKSSRIAVLRQGGVWKVNTFGHWNREV